MVRRDDDSNSSPSGARSLPSRGADLPGPSVDRARRYLGWLQRRTRAILVATAAVLAAAVALIAFDLPLLADFSYLLPQDAPAVRDLRRLQQRMVAKDTTLLLIVAPDSGTRAAAAALAAGRLRALGKDLVERVEDDDRETRAFFRAHRHLYVPLEDLIAARDALAARLAGAKLRANPLFIDLEADDPARAAEGEAERARLDQLRAKRRAAEAALDRSGHVSADGTTAMLVVKTSFRATDVPRAHRLLAALGDVRAAVIAAYPTVTIGLTGGVPTTVAEHRALVRGMLLSSLVTGALVGLVLLVHLRSTRMLVLVTLNIAIATAISFGLAAVTVGHLNAATAFLGAIIAGNGVNYGILLIARYLEERRRALPAEAMAVAIAGTLRPTVVAALGAAVAYGSLAATSFKGFADFAIIGGAGMLVCWISSFVVLPALVLRFAAGARPGMHAPVLGRLLAWGLGFRRPAAVCVVLGVVSVAAAAVTWRYVASDPFEYDMTRLRSDAPDAVATRDWMRVADQAFGQGIAAKTYIAVDDPRQLPALVTALRELRAHTAAGRATIGVIASILDVVPPDQDQRLAVLAAIRGLLDDPALAAQGDRERSELAALRPPDDLRAFTAADLPRGLKNQLTETDGKIGYMVSIRPTPAFDEWNGRDLIAFAGAVREVRLASGETMTTSGASVVFADILQAIQHDGPIVTLAAAIGLVIMVLAVVGRDRRALAVLLGTATGSLAMVAACAIAGLRVDFLDFVALPITLGLGIDYAINVADRAAHDALAVTLRTTGTTVLVCSLTTMIGYASLLVSDNLAIRGFGLASLIGEITCVATALTLVPALVRLRLR